LAATFTTGDNNAIATILLVDDKVVNEQDEEFRVSLGILPTTGVRIGLGDVSTAIGTIRDTSMEKFCLKVL